MSNVQIVRTEAQPNEWMVEAFDADGDGGIEITVFAGPDAQSRAGEYARWRYRATTARAA